MASEDSSSVDSGTHWQQIWEAFHRVRDCRIPSEREVFLSELQSVNPDLAANVKELIEADQESGEFLQELVAGEVDLLHRLTEKEDSTLRPDDMLSERFRIVRQIGKGGMGTVYEAFDQELGVPVALKVMRRDSFEFAARERFQREIHLARQVTHPNACRIFELFRDGNSLFLTMELLHGQTLQDRIRNEGKMDVSVALPIVLQIIEALAAIHAAGIVHRDLKSSNILLVKEEDRTRAIVTDFGLATTLAPDPDLQVTQTGVVLGTPEFMAPEQLSNQPITSSTDVYQLGLVMYEMLTGEVPLAGASPLTIAARRINEDAPSPRRLIPDLDRNWERVILKCLERNPKHRFQSARDVLHAIKDRSVLTKLSLFPSRSRARLLYIFLLIACGVIASLLMLIFIRENTSSRELEVKRLWTGATGMPPGVLSTDGRVLIDVEWLTADLVAVDFSSGRKRHITRSSRYFLPQNFSPFPVITCLSRDSKKIAYSVKREWDAGCELRVVNLDGSNPKTLYSNTESCIAPMDWSPNLKSVLAVIQHPDGSSQIRLISEQDKSNQTLKSVQGGSIRKMGFSADGRYIAYDLSEPDRPDHHDIFLLSLSDRSERKLVEHPANDYFLAWAPDGKQILFASDRSGSHDAWALSFADGETQETPASIRKDIGQIFPLKLTADGSLFYSQLLTSHDIYVVPLNSDGTRAAAIPQKMVHGFSGSNDGPEFSPDGQTMIFQSSQNPLMTRWMVNQPNSIKSLSLKTNEVSDFPYQMKGVSGRFRWSPDGQAVLSFAVSHQGTGIYRLFMKTGEWTNILPTHRSSAIRQYYWNPDASSVFFLNNKGGNLLQKELSTGSIKKIHSGVDDFALSNDGRTLLLMKLDTQAGSTVLQVMPTDGGNVDEILKIKMPEWISAIAWAPDSRHVFYAKGRRDRIDDPHRLWKMSIDGKHLYDLGIETESVLDLRIHPDGKKVAIWTVMDTSDVWVMKNFLKND